MPGCPFYGFRWPDCTTMLQHVGANECGLDFDDHRPCLLERRGRPVEYRACSVVSSRRNLLEIGKPLIRFDLPDGGRPTLADWEKGRSW
jgi:hypothetical protein